MATRTKAAPSRSRKAPSRAKKAPARTKKAPSRAAAGKPKVISKRTIRSVIRKKLDPRGTRPVKWDAPIGDYIKGGVPAIRAFFGPLNRAFKAYALNLRPGDLANVKIVEDLVIIVANWFRRHGYQVTE
jgi:hypothetical protein